jgi:hypothetical protein
MTAATISSVNKRENIRVYLRVKWLILALLLLSNMYEYATGVDAGIQAVIAFLGLFIAALPALIIELYIRRGDVPDVITHLSFCVDVLAIVFVLYFQGGMENNWSFLPIFVILMSSYVFGFRAGLALAIFSFAIIFTMAITQYLGLVPHFPLFDLPVEHWRSTQYLFDYATGMFVLYMASAFAVGFVVQLAARRAERVSEFKQRIENTDRDEAQIKDRVRQAKVEILVKNAELERLQAVSAERQLMLIELRKELEDLRGGK